MNKIEKLHDTLFKYGYFYDPLFVEDYIIDVNHKNVLNYDEKQDLLFLNSKVKNGINLYKEFVKKNYKKYFDQDVYSKYKKMLSSILEVASDYEKRYFGFSTRIPLEVLAKKNNIKDNTDELNDTTLFNILDEKINRSIYMCTDIVKNGVESEYFDECYNNLALDFENTGIKKEYLKDEYLLKPLFMKLRNEYIDDASLLKSLAEISQNVISADEFFSCYDIDKFFLLFGKIMIEKSKIYSEKYNEMPTIFPQVYNYIHFVEELGLDSYNPKILISKDNKKKQKLVNYLIQSLIMI